jgi:hypothetical protein
MASLTGQTIASSYDALLKLTDNGPITSDLKLITDGLGNSTCLSLSSLGASITGTLAVSSTLTASNLSGTNTGDETQATIKSKLGAATTSVDGYLTSTDWTTFNNKVATTRSISTSAPLSGGGDLSANRTLSIAQATTSTNGYLSSTDWTTFNSKQDLLINPIVGTSTRTTNFLPIFSSATGITNSDIYKFGTTYDFSNASNVIINRNLQVYDLGDGEYSLTANLSGVFVSGNLQINNSGGASLLYNPNTSALSIGGTLTMSGALTGATSISMGGALTGATDITGSGKLSIANIGASGTLNVGSTTTATKRLEITGNNNAGAENNTLRFVNTDTTILTDELIGKIEFYSNDISSPGASVKAYISASATTSSPQGYLDFATDELTGTPTVKQRILANGRVLIGSTTDNTSGNLVQVNGGLDYNIVIRSTSVNPLTLALTDKGKFITLTAGSSVVIPTEASVNFPIGTQIWFVQQGVSSPTFSGDTGVTLRTRSSVRQPFAQFSEVKLTKTASDLWYLTGDLKA